MPRSFPNVHAAVRSRAGAPSRPVAPPHPVVEPAPVDRSHPGSRPRPRRRALVLTLAAIGGAWSARPADAADAITASKISRVTVYEDRALVERTASLPVDAGTTRVVLPGFPAGFDVNSLRARSTDVRVLGVDVETVALAHEALPAAEAARKEWDKARRDLSAAEMDLADAKDTWERLKSVRAVAVDRGGQGLGGGAVDAKSITQVLDLVDEEGRKARRRSVELQSVLETARSAEDAAHRRFDQLAAAAQREETRVVVTVSAAAAGRASLAVQYLVGNAGWTPLYDLRVSEDFSSTSLEMHGVVRQRTGEDWEGVPMELTTARPSAGAAPPEPQPWIVDLWAPKSRVMHDSDSGRLAETAGPPAPAPAAKLSGFVAAVRRSGVVVAFASSLPASAKSDGQPSRVALGRFDLAGDVRWTAFPRATDKVFVTTKVKNKAGSALPAGEARVFVGPDFVGPMQLADWGQDKEIEVGLGVDREVEAARETLLQARSTEGVFSKDTVHDRGYRITVKNHRDRTISVRLLDQIPVSRDEDLKVEITSNSLAFAKLPDRDAEDNKARGVLEWRADLGPKRELDVRFGFKATHPKDHTIVGLE